MDSPVTAQQVGAITYQAEAHRTPSAVTKAANADLTHDLKPRRLPPLQNYKTVTAASPSSPPPPLLLLKPPRKLPTDSSSTSFSSLLSDPGPLGSAQRAGCSSVKQRRRAERAPTDSYSALVNDIIEILILLFACGQAIGSHLSLEHACWRRQDGWMGVGGGNFYY